MREVPKLAKNLSISMLLDFYGEMLTPKQRDMIVLYYNEDLSLAEIAELSGITRQGVRDCIKRAEFQLLEYEQKLGLAERFSLVQEGLDEIVRSAAQIQEESGKVAYLGKMRENACHIIEIAAGLNPE